MKRRASLTRHENYAYNPWETRVDWRWRCSVCGFAGIDPERWQQPEQEVYQLETTGTLYQPPAGTPVEGLAALDRVVTKVQSPYAGCPLCNSPNWAFGSAPDIRA